MKKLKLQNTNVYTRSENPLTTFVLIVILIFGGVLIAIIMVRPGVC